nr:serine/arginine repetitive matrix protein 2-like [Penaeus vannamei]
MFVRRGRDSERVPRRRRKVTFGSRFDPRFATMAVPMTLHEDHQVLGEDYCSGYIDTFGKWSNGFPCPSLETEEPVYCCGTNNFKYCCTKRDMQNITRDIPQLPLILGVVFGVAVAVIVIVVVSCFHCSCCLLYKKRQPTNGASGVANMYSFSGTTTPSETPRSLSRASSRSHGTVESAGSVSSNHFDHRNLLDGEEPRAPVQTFAVDRRVLGPRPGGSRSQCLRVLVYAAKTCQRSAPVRSDVSVVALECHVAKTRPRGSSATSGAICCIPTLGVSRHDHSTRCTAPPQPPCRNMYSFSGTTTPRRRRGPLSRYPPPRFTCSSLDLRSHGTVESAGSVSSNHFDHRNLLDGEEPRAPVQTFAVDRRVLGPRPVSLNMSDRSSSISEGGPTDPPPPYSAPHSTLVAVRTSSAYALAATPRPPSPTYGHHNPYVISGGDSGYSSGPLATFPQTFLSPASPARPPPLRITSAMPQTFAPALTPTTRPCSTAHIIHTHHPGPDENLYTATKF